MSLSKLSREMGATQFYTPEFRAVLEDHMFYLRQPSSSTVLTVVADLAYKFECDLYGYLANLGVPMQMHWIIMRASNMMHPNELKRTTKYLIYPNADKIERIRQSYSVVTRIG